MRASALLVSLAALAAGCASLLPADPEAPAPVPLPFAADCSIAPGKDLWPDLCTALASPNPSPGKAEIDLAVNPKDPLNIITASKDLDRRASNCVWSVLQVTKDGGQTWKTVYVGGDKDRRVEMLKPYNCITDPIMVFDKNGVAYYALQAYDSANPIVNGVTSKLPLPSELPQPSASSFVLARSKDGGETWDKYAQQALGDGDLVFHDYPRMLVSPKTGAVHTIWNGVGRSGVSPWVSTTRDGGETVDPPVTFQAEDAPRDTQFFSGFAATADGTLWVTVNKGDDSDSGYLTDVYLFQSKDDARSFAEVGYMFSFTPTPRQLAQNAFRTPSFVELAAAQAGDHAGRLHAFYPDYATGQSDILSRFSDDGGQTWSEPVNVATNAAGDQLFMRPKVGPDGTVFVLFASRAWDPDNVLLDQVLAFSEDGGETWQNLRLTQSSFDGDLGVHQSGFRFIGDYNGLDVAPDGSVFAAWGDTRTGVAEIAFATVRPR